MTATSAPKRIFILDDHPLTRHGIVEAIDTEEGLRVCGQADSLIAGREGISRTKPDLVLSDLRFAQGDALAFLHELRDRHPRLPVVVVSMLAEDVYGVRCLDAGARAFVAKSAPIEVLLEAVRTVLAGNVWVSQTVINARFRVNGGASPHGSVDSLSNRELQVFRMVGEGAGRRQIADALGVAETTVDSHKEHIKVKLNLSSASDLGTRATLWVQGQF